MQREYDLFERFPDNSVLWHAVVNGLENAQLMLQELAKKTSNQCFALHRPTNQIVARVNSARVEGQGNERVIFQIAYDEKLLVTRAELLKYRGYDVVSVIGNESAMVVLSSIQRYDLFILGHAASLRTREEMVAWLKTRYPEVKILALNPPQHQDLPGADYNVELNGPEKWLALVTAAAS